MGFHAQFSKFCRDEEGATMVEYGLMLALIAIVCIAAVTFLGLQASALFEDGVLINGLQS